VQRLRATRFISETGKQLVRAGRQKRSRPRVVRPAARFMLWGATRSWQCRHGLQLWEIAKSIRRDQI